MEPATRWRAPAPGRGYGNAALRDRRAIEKKIKREFEELSAAALEARVQREEPLPPLPRVYKSKKVDGLRMLVLGLRLAGLCPVYRENLSSKVSPRPSSPTDSRGADGLPRVVGKAARPITGPFLVRALSLHPFSGCVRDSSPVLRRALAGPQTLITLMELNNPDISTGLINVLSAVAYFASCISALTFAAGARRKFQLLHRLLNWTACSTATAHPNTLTLLLYIGPIFCLYAITDYGTVLDHVSSCVRHDLTPRSFFFFRYNLFSTVHATPRPAAQPETSILLFSAVVSVLERLLLMFLAGRACRCFKAVNKELHQLSSLFRQRARLQYVPDAAAKIAQLRAQHEMVAGFLELATQAYEMQICGILLYDFGTTILTMYQFIVHMVRGYKAPTEQDGAVTNDLAIVMLVNTMYSNVATVCLCNACFWTHREGSTTHYLVHKALSCIRISEEECSQVTLPFPSCQPPSS
ncbi:putative metalloprotease [Frankliniella fusca]|uniref:Metalloprotease n=1 Tax=Frankliniella fusca TaxID=407009 RepID=A0AAE1HA00_9NEOP|nr:putative metalloprotease [Frankliniella fusca]